jgi:hypothetical protein
MADFKENKATVTKLLHFIWVGGAIPDKQLNKAKESLKQLGKDWKACLWISTLYSMDRDKDGKRTAEGTASEAYKKNKGASGFTVFDMEKSLNFSQTEKDALKVEWSITPWNPGAMSDIIRAAILDEHGGIYCDTDCSLKKKVEDLKPKWGFWAATGNEKSPKSTIMSNCMMASVKGGDYIKAYRKWINDEYKKVLAKGNVAKGELAKIQEHLRGDPSKGEMEAKKRKEEITLLLTGPVALQACVMSSKLEKLPLTAFATKGVNPADETKHLKFPDEYVNVGYDNSWL